MLRDRDEQAVQQRPAFLVRAAGKQRTVRAERAGARASLDVPRSADDAGHEGQERRVPARRRKSRDEVFAHHRLPPRALNVDNGRLAGHDDGFLEGADFHVSVHGRDERPRQLDPFPPDGSEALERERHAVGSGSQVFDPVPAAAIGGSHPDLFNQLRA